MNRAWVFPKSAPFQKGSFAIFMQGSVKTFEPGLLRPLGLFCALWQVLCPDLVRPTAVRHDRVWELQI